MDALRSCPFDMSGNSVPVNFKEEIMKRYTIKSRPGRSEYVDILKETDEGYAIRLTKVSDGYEKIQEDFINRHLFDLCVKTGYLSELAAAAFSVA
jgi:hypothetical protein